MKESPFNDPGKFWDERFGDVEYRYGREPNAFVAQVLPGLVAPGARVLCVGDGEGRNGVWCAGQGFETTSLEPSKAGTEKIAALARERGVELEIIQGTMSEEAVGGEGFDAVVLAYVHAPPAMRAEIHSASVAVLRPGGVVVLEAFTPAQRLNDRPSGGPPVMELLFTAEMLREDFGALEIELLREEEVELREGEGHRGPGDVVRLIARKR